MRWLKSRRAKTKQKSLNQNKISFVLLWCSGMSNYMEDVLTQLISHIEINTTFFGMKKISKIWCLEKKIKVESNLAEHEILIGIFTVDEIAFLEYWKKLVKTRKKFVRNFLSGHVIWTLPPFLLSLFILLWSHWCTCSTDYFFITVKAA